MSSAGPVSELLLRWEELRERGQAVSAEELCRDRPELVDDVRRRIAALEAVYRVPNRLPSGTLPDLGGRAGAVAEPLHLPGYEVLGVLGSGGMGVVYKARDVRLKRLVALKMILTGPHARPEERDRFRREAEAVARLQHANVVQIYEVGEHDGRPYLALEYVGGGSLAERLGGKPQPVEDAARLVRTLALAVHAAHQSGVVHRDLKPANVLLQIADGGLQIEDKSAICNLQSAIPKITDFGLAKRLDEAGQTQTGAVLGTPSYMAPEQALGDVHGIGPHTDVHALGAILYELLTGRAPFAGATLLETLDQVRSQEPQPPRRQRPDVPRDLETICRKCLEKEPQRRYPSAKALADDLGRYLDGELIHARSFTFADRLARTLNRSGHIDQVRVLWPLLLAIAPLPFVLHLLPFLLLRGTPAYPLACAGVSMGLVALLLVIFIWITRPGSVFIWPALAQQLMPVRVAHCLGMAMSLVVCRLLLPDGPWALAAYPVWTVLTATLFFSMGGALWGRLYLAGLGLFALAFVMPWRLEWAPVEFGLVLSALITLIGFRFRHQRRAAATAPDPSTLTRPEGKS
jgi:serine/threonine protein kinase